MIHELKAWQPFYNDLVSGTKTFELRKNDRGFQVGDKLILYEYDHINKTLSAKYIVKEVTYILHGGAWGLEEGYVIMGLK